MNKFRFGIQLREMRFDQWRQRVRRYQELGFESIHFPDHFFWQQWDPLAGLGAIAAVADRVAVGTSVLDLGFYQPAVLARWAATLAGIAGGGCELGLGAGWSGDDYRVAGIPYEAAGARIERLVEALQLIPSLWEKDETDFHGQHYTLDHAPPVLTRPLPRRPRLLVGGTRPRVLGIAGAHADIVSVFASLEQAAASDMTRELESVFAPFARGSTMQLYAEKTGWAREGAVKAGRDPDALELHTIVTHTAVAEDAEPWRTRLLDEVKVEPGVAEAAMTFLIGSPAQVRDTLQQRREATGISYYVIQRHEIDEDFAYIEGLAKALGPLIGT